MALVQQNESREPQFNGASMVQPPNPSPTVEEDKINSLSKRQRRPSVRLNEIGDQPAAALTKHSKSPLFNPARPSKTRPLTNLHVDNLAIGTWKLKGSGAGSKVKRDSKRPRTNWVSKEVDDDEPGPVSEVGFSKDFELEGSQSPFKQNPNPNPNPNPDDGDGDDEDNVRDLQFRAHQSFRATNEDVDDDDDSDLRDVQFRALQNVRARNSSRINDDDDDGNPRALQFRAHQSVRARNDNDDGVDLDGPSDDSGRRLGKQDDHDGVRVWLDGLGLGRYWLVFKIHEVDEEVLPFLTLEDLKDMGISAVGSRRKLYCAIKKLYNDNDDGFS